MATRDQLSVFKVALLVLAPLAVRVAVWRELTRSPFFEALFVDARIYHEMAMQMSAEGGIATTPYWQPPLYPLFLGQLYKWAGPHPDIARGAGVLLGVVSCFLVFLIARRFFGTRAGWIAWCIVAFSGPMIFFDLQLLNASLGITLALGCLWLWSGTECLTAKRARPDARKASQSPQAPKHSDVSAGPVRRRDLRPQKSPSFAGELLRSAGAGLCGGLAAITIGNMLLLAPVIVTWTLFRHPRRTALYWLALMVFALAALIPPASVTVRNYEISGEWIGVSYNSGINYWIGNNPEHDRTVAVRPGRAWVAWTDEPREQGHHGYREQSNYFFKKSRSWFVADPVGAARLQLRKVALFLRGDEVMRNQEIYPFRRDSRILTLLLWSKGFALPFGILLPVAAAATISLWTDRKRFSSRWRILPGLILIYSLSVVAFFVTSRYRLPIVPLLAILVGGGATLWIGRFVRGPWTSLLAPSLVAVVVFGVSARGVPLATTDFNSDAYYDLGVHLQTQDDYFGARVRYEQALDRNPFNYEAMNNLAGLSLRDGDLDAAAHYLRGVLKAYPEDTRARYNLGLVYLDQGKPYDAGGQFHQVLAAHPEHARAAEKLARAEAMSRQLEGRKDGEDEEAVVDMLLGTFRANPNNGFVHQRLRALLLERGRDAEVADVDRTFAESKNLTSDR